jgi:uncharacterized OB-fold protein
MAEYRGMHVFVQPFDKEHKGFFEAARRHKLVVQKCTACGKLRGSPGTACPFCTSPDWEWHEVSGRGVIYSYQIVTQAMQPQFRDWAPYPVILVELDEQRREPWHHGEEGESVSVRLVANLVKLDDPTQHEDEENVAIGMRVQVCFVDLDDEISLPQFCLTDEPPEHKPWKNPS